MSQPSQMVKPTEVKPASDREALAAPPGSEINPALGKASNPPQRHAVRNGIIRILGFFTLMILLIYGLNAMINCGLHRLKTDQFGVSNAMVQGRINADIIISGSSRALCDYDPRVIQSATGLTAFDLGRNGSQTDMQLAVLKTYLKHNRKPSLIVHSLDAFSFVTTRQVYDPAQYLPYLDQKDIYDALRKINPDVWWKCKYLPLYGYVAEDLRLDWMLAPLGLLGWSPHQDFLLGYCPRSSSWSDDFASFKAANPGGVDFAIEPDGISQMKDLISTCQENGIPLVFVYSPEYHDMQLLTKNRAEIFAQFHELSSQYRVPFWDFSDWAYSGDRDYFQNSQHLNENGAEAFSRDLAKRLEEFLQTRANTQGTTLAR